MVPKIRANYNGINFAILKRQISRATLPEVLRSCQFLVDAINLPSDVIKGFHEFIVSKISLVTLRDKPILFHSQELILYGSCPFSSFLKLFICLTQAARDDP